MIELLECVRPAVERRDANNYRETRITELGLEVDDIDGWFERVRVAGYRTTTEQVWQCGSIGRAFLFEDQDGNLIQFWQPIEEAKWIGAS